MVMVDTNLGVNQPLGDLGLNGLLTEWGITLRDDFVLDLASSQVTDPGVTIAAKYGNSPITSKLGNMAVAFPLARSIAVTATSPANVSVVPLVETSEQSWGASDLNAVMNGFRSGQIPGPGTQDAKGPLNLAVSATNSQTGARLVLLGSSGFAANSFTRWPGNTDFFLNSVNWLAEQESQITIRPKPFETRQLVPSVGMTVQLFGINVILLPLAILVVGAIVWWRRR
jgi:ABC-type uncharacterized transport system involved in gliding motility auxiliary subunit